MCGAFWPELLNIDHQVELVWIGNLVMEVLSSTFVPVGIRLHHVVAGLLKIQVPAFHDLLDPVLQRGDDTNT